MSRVDQAKELAVRTFRSGLAAMESTDDPRVMIAILTVTSRTLVQLLGILGQVQIGTGSFKIPDQDPTPEQMRESVRDFMGDRYGPEVTEMPVSFGPLHVREPVKGGS